MAANKLKLNDQKTEFVLIGKQAHLSKTITSAIKVGDSTITPNKSARNLGFQFDAAMDNSDHISKM